MAITEIGGIFKSESFVTSSTSGSFATGSGANRVALGLSIGAISNATPAPTGISLSGGDTLSALTAQFTESNGFKCRLYGKNGLTGTGSQTATATRDDSTGQMWFMVLVLQGDGALTLGTPATGGLTNTSVSLAPGSSLSDYVVALMMEYGGGSPSFTPGASVSMSSTFAASPNFAFTKTGAAGSTTINGTFGSAAVWAAAALAITEAAGGSARGRLTDGVLVAPYLSEGRLIA